MVSPSELSAGPWPRRALSSESPENSFHCVDVSCGPTSTRYLKPTFAGGRRFDHELIFNGFIFVGRKGHRPQDCSMRGDSEGQDLVARHPLSSWRPVSSSCSLDPLDFEYRKGAATAVDEHHLEVACLTGPPESETKSWDRSPYNVVTDDYECDQREKGCPRRGTHWVPRLIGISRLCGEGCRRCTRRSRSFGWR